jgi:transposase
VEEVITLGLDLAKGVFQVHGEDGEGRKVWSRPLRRAQMEPFFRKLPACVVAMEACSSAHHWGRRLTALGHQVRLIPPVYVKPFVARNKTDARDAEAICQAAQRPNIRTVGIKTREQQARGCLHRVRDLLVRQRTQAANQIRGLASEFGLIARPGHAGLRDLIAQIKGSDLPEAALRAIAAQARHHRGLDDQIAELEAQIVADARASEPAKRMMTIPGVAEITASAVLAQAPDMTIFRSGRDFAAWLGLTPLQRSSGGKQASGGISKRGDKTLRRLLILGATARLAHQRRSKRPDPWLAGLLVRRPFRVAAVALAAKTARIIWALLVRGGVYQSRHQPKLAV